MASPTLSCPVCDADLMLAGDERLGDSVICTYCGAPFTVMRVPRADEDASIELEEDW